jgi:hypothetical protein
MDWRKQWSDDLHTLGTASKGVIESYALSQAQVAALALEPDLRDQTTRALISIIGQWLEHVVGRRQPPPLCLACDLQFRRPNQAELIIVSLPFGTPVGGLCSGVCSRCVNDPQLGEKIRALLRRIWPNIHDIEVGRVQ